jgi:thymidylate synthase
MTIFITADTFAEAYDRLLGLCFHEPDAICRPRGMEVRELISPAIRVLNPLDKLYTSPVRSTPMRYLAGEFVWYFAQRNDAEFISRYSAFWNQIKNRNGVILDPAPAPGTAKFYDVIPPGSVNSSYGHLMMAVRDARWAGGRAISQWVWALESMLKDPDTRQAVLHVNRPGHQHDWIRDFPCTMSLQFLLRDGKLNLVVHMRSNDLIMGLTYDFPMFAFFQEVFMYHLNKLRTDSGKDPIQLGHLTLFAGSSHIYDRNYAMVEGMLGNLRPVEGMTVPLGVSPVFVERRGEDLVLGKSEALEWLERTADGLDPAGDYGAFPWYGVMAGELRKVKE